MIVFFRGAINNWWWCVLVLARLERDVTPPGWAGPGWGRIALTTKHTH